MSRGVRPRSWPKSDLGLIGKMFLITIETARIVTVPKLVAPRSPPVTFSSAPQRSELDAGCRRVTWF